ncbi:hypothetical protein DEU56DRAFT_712948, partial [Suillus clintonianus]|uniref:uncharacterized protein n=1 Tax=Suillus clintonianus TaxID=1904413 RepID=UPI001B875946
GNEAADVLANQGAQKNKTDLLNLDIPADFDLQGAKLAMITQVLAHQGIQEKTHIEYKRTTLMNLDITRRAIKEISTTLETDDNIWSSCRHPDISKAWRD